MARRSPLETKIHHERWLVSYSDFITLLFAFFVVMYSVSQVNENKYRTLSATLKSAFSTAADQPTGQGSQQQQQLAALDTLEQQLTEALHGLIDEGKVQVVGNQEWVEIALNASVLFSSGSAEASDEARTVFADVAAILAPYDNAVAVSGHTDNVPISNQRYANNWELSAARAVAVVNILAADGVQPARLSAIGLGEFRPVADNLSEEGRNQNRRVVLQVARSAATLPTIPAADFAGEQGVIPTPTPPAGETPEQPVQGAAPVSASTPPIEPEISAGLSPLAAPVKPVKLEGGGLLFTSDPDLPRLNAPTAQPTQAPSALPSPAPSPIQESGAAADTLAE